MGFEMKRLYEAALGAAAVGLVACGGNSPEPSVRINNPAAPAAEAKPAAQPAAPAKTAEQPAAPAAAAKPATAEKTYSEADLQRARSEAAATASAAKAPETPAKQDPPAKPAAPAAAEKPAAPAGGSAEQRSSGAGNGERVPVSPNTEGVLPGCTEERDGKEVHPISLPRIGANLDRFPAGRVTDRVIGEAAYPVGQEGFPRTEGFGGLQRINLLLDVKPEGVEFNFKPGFRNARFIQHCGALARVKERILNWHTESHARASQDGQGRRPSLEEIPAFYLDFRHRIVEELKPGYVTAEQFLGLVEVSQNIGGQGEALTFRVKR